MPRPIWSGSISFGLVSIPVKLFNAVNRKSVSFNQLDDRDLSRIKYRKVSAATGEEVPDEHIVKGYELSKDRYVVVDPDELEPFMPVPTRSIDLEEFVDLADIDPLFYDSAYYLAPDKVTKPYVLLVEAMEAAGKVAVGRFVMRNKQYVAAIRAKDGVLVLSTMVFADEVVSPAAIDELAGLDQVEITDRERTMAEALVESLSEHFEPEKYHDAYREQVLDLIAKKGAGEEMPALVPAASAPAVVDLMAALEASVQAAKQARQRHPSVGQEPAEAQAGDVAEAVSTAVAAEHR
ncbi:MAG TPA: Ku protein, partial [Acidimicrobiales bacterium]